MCLCFCVGYCIYNGCLSYNGEYSRHAPTPAPIAIYYDGRGPRGGGGRTATVMVGSMFGVTGVPVIDRRGEHAPPTYAGNQRTKKNEVEQLQYELS